MTDFFVLLRLPRRPHLSADEVNARFVEFSMAAHPDRTNQDGEAEKSRATAEFALLNNAQLCLREKTTRLRHLIELERGFPPGDVEQVPAENLGLLMKVAQICRQVDVFLEARRREPSPLLRLRLFQQGMDWIDALQVLQEALRKMEEALVARLAGWNPLWDGAPPLGDERRAAALPLTELEEAYRALSFQARSSRQIQERIVQLTLD